ncbi:PTS sugar transporter subunit IIA [Mycoplasmopsis columboralis]|uniref:PTS system protein n=1 Tax=Mycoplasmopsis columboralis TaxID=171282 RepID=A0A449B5W9_9BACT|nr:PTS sugar transporter subunit IIA [Mycoplasmopsis columboralis]VEU76004.1 PTS system protein [Mycoplasmopsis columboralis]
MECRIKDLVSTQSIFLDVSASDHDEVLFKVSELLAKNNLVENAQKFYDALLYRENLMPTALNDGIAVPHGISSTVVKPFVSIVRLKEGVDWHAEDKQVVKLLFILGTSREERDYQIDVLQMISLWSLDDDLIQMLHTEKDPQKIKDILDQKELYIS